MLGLLFPGAGTGLEAPRATLSGPAGVAVRKPAWRLLLSGRDVTRDLAPMVLSVEYSDYAEGNSDEVELIVENADGRWRDGWYPDEGTDLELWIGYLGEPLLPCGRFEIDEVQISGPPDTVTIRALASGVTPSLRTRQSTSYEAQTLMQIADKVAGRHGLTVTGLNGDLRVNRITQDRENDLSFLTGLAQDYGYVFSVRGEQLVFYELRALEEAAPLVTFSRREVARHRLTQRTKGIYRAAEVRYHDAEKKEVVTQTVEADGVLTGDVYKFYARVENQQQAEERARAELRRHNATAIDGTISKEGDPEAVAGINASLDDFGRLTGKVHIEKTDHRLTRSGGYETTAHVRSVPA